MVDKGISAVAITADEIRKNPEIWKDVENGVYRIVYASPEVLLREGSYFWMHLLRKKCAFNTRLVGVAIDEVHVVWGYREFRSEYGNIGDFRAHLRRVPFIGLSATLTPRMLEYIHPTLRQSKPTILYREPVGRRNVTIAIAPIDRSSTGQGYALLDFVIDDKQVVQYLIPQTFIFVDTVEEASQVAHYLRQRLHPQLRPVGTTIIKVMTACLEVSTRNLRMEQFREGNHRIIVGTEVVAMGINFESIDIVFQWDVREHLSLAAVWQRIGRAARNPAHQALAVIFTPERYILPRDNDEGYNSMGRYFGWQQAISGANEEKVNQLVKNLCRSRPESTIHSGAHCPYDAIDPALLLFLNTVGCRWRAGLVCFDDKAWITGEGLAIPTSNATRPQCCDNCLFNTLSEEELDILDDSFLTLHRFDFRRTIRYHHTKEYEDEQHIAQVHKYLNTEVARNKKMSPEVKGKIREGLISWRGTTFSSDVKPSYPYLSAGDFLSADAITKILNSIATINTRGDLARILEPLLSLESSVLAASTESLLGCIGELQKLFELEPATNTEGSRPQKKRKYDFAHVPEGQLNLGIPSQKALLDSQRAIDATDYATFEKKEVQRIQTAHRRAAAYLEKRKISLYNEKAKQLNLPTKESELTRKARTTQPHRRGQQRSSKNQEMVSRSIILAQV